MLTIFLKAALVGTFAFVVALAVFLMKHPSDQPPQYHTNQSAANESQDTAKDDDAGKTFRQRMLIIWRNTTNDAVAFFTFWLAVFSCMLVIVAAFQVWLLLRAERISVNISQAAKQSADVAERTLTELERPYIFVETPKFIPATTATAAALLTIEVTYSDVFDWMHVSEFTYFESGGSFHAIAGKKYNRSKSEKLPEGVEWTPAWSEKRR